MTMKPGDLVRYVANPPTKIPRRRVIPHNKEPLGVIVEISTKLIGEDPEMQSILEVVYVRWSETSWNNSGGGVSEEYRCDLEVFQKS